MYKLLSSLLLLLFSGLQAFAQATGSGTDLEYFSANPLDVVSSTPNRSFGSAWGDYDNDGDPDLFITNSDQSNHNALYRNNGGGSFTRIVSGELVHEGATSLGCAWGDYDNDGYLDLYVVNGDAFTHTPERNFLYHNEGNGTFTKITQGEIVQDLGISRSCAWGDYDNDGYLDLFVANEGSPNVLYHNAGKGTFTKVSLAGNEVAENQQYNYSLGCNWVDYDNDTYPDLFVTSNWGANQLYHNNRNGSFTPVTDNPIVAPKPTIGDKIIGTSVSGSWGDYDNNGYLDLFVTNNDSTGNFLYYNHGGGQFTQITYGAIAKDKERSHGSAWTDYDKDGDVDLFVANDKGYNFLYQNSGDTTFTKLSHDTLVVDPLGALGSSWADHDQDGDPDLMLVQANEASQIRSNILYTNHRSSYHWINIRLNGTVSNTFGVGAKVRVLTNGQWQTQEIGTQTGCTSQGGLNALFGLKRSRSVDEIEVVWPSGLRTVLTNVPANQSVTISEAAPSAD